MITVHLTTYLPADALRDKPIRRRRLLGRGNRVRFALREGFFSDPELSTHALLLDGEPIAYALECEWHSVDGNWWGTGLDITEAA